MKIRVSRRARARIQKQDDWWRTERRDTPDLFKEELGAAFTRILRAPRIRQVHGQIEGETIWRVLLPRTEQHVYYSVNDTADEVVIETIWGARRGRGPRI